MTDSFPTICSTPTDLYVDGQLTDSQKEALKREGGKWYPKDKRYHFPPYLMYRKAIEEILPLASPSEYMEPEEKLIPSQEDHPRLYPFQREAIGYLLTHSKCILELAPRLGKTTCSLIAAQKLQAKNVLIIVPKSLRLNWIKEAEIWVPGQRLDVVHGRGPDLEENWVVTNYDTFVRNRIEFARKWDVCIVDESIMLKSRGARSQGTHRLRAFRTMRYRFQRLWLLSGSPVSRYFDDLWAQLNLLDKSAFSSYWRFAERYCEVEETPWSKRVVRSREDRDPRTDLQDIMFSRSQEEVGFQLPEIIFQTINVEPSPFQQRLHDSLLADFIADMETGEGERLLAPSKVAQLTRLQQVVSSPSNVGSDKPSAKHDVVMEMLETKTIEFPLLIWTHWVEGAKELFDRITQAKHTVALVTGSIVGESHNGTGGFSAVPNTDTLIEGYKQRIFPILILATGVGKFGHTLPMTNTVIYLDKTWDADAYYQSFQRVRHLQSTHHPAVITLRSPGTIDDLVEANLEGKLYSITKINNADLATLLRGLNG